ncbi:MAG: hypothetical protein E7566_04820 [Ruminococcaceae bacterium]|nr:hypothetical protein [Oscillospiraceae bacterium]
MKKIISVLMVITMVLSLGVFSASAEEETSVNYWIAETPDIDPDELPGTVFGYLGDADRNTFVNVKDATAIQKHVAGIITLDDSALDLSDVDFSENINVKDATAIQKWVAGLLFDNSFISHALYEAYELDERLFGKWECTTDIGAEMNELLPLFFDDPKISKYIKIRSCMVTETYEFFDDYSYCITTDEISANKAIDIIKSDFGYGLLDYMVAVTKESGYDVTPKELLAAMGYLSMDEYINDMFPADLFGDISEPVVSFYRTTPDGKLYLDEYSDTVYNFYTVETDTFTLTGDNENLMPELYPITFTKIK